MHRTTLLMLCAALAGSACNSDTQSAASTAAQSQLTTQAPSFPCLNAPTLKPTIPGDTVVSDQVSLDCFAWQQFIALNWPADGKQPFGQPGDTRPVVWETYMDKETLLPKDGSAPPPWGSADRLPKGAQGPQGGPLRILRDISKVPPTIQHDTKVGVVGMGDNRQAFPFNGPAWLADVHGNVVWYEVVVNQDEYDYFVQTGYYNSNTQVKKLAAKDHINLPKGILNGATGAMELKAAWLTVSDPKDPKWQRYKLTTATLCDAQDRCTQGTVALVGLHIIHKTASQPSWIWATFEHIDNAPDQQQVQTGKLAGPYNFYNAGCARTPPPKPPASCLGKGQSWAPCQPNTPPLYELSLDGGKPVGQCLPYPIQVVRQFPLQDSSENPVVTVNAATQAMIAAAKPDSVWQYYQLVNVLWNDSPVDENAKGTSPPKAPLSSTGFRPNPHTTPVANTTMETYIQSATCIACHSAAQSAPNSNGVKTGLASDYSFLFKQAGPPPKK